MFPDGPEVPLAGGDVTEGVVRIGDTVRRPRGPHSATVQRVLEHLASVGFTGCPRWLGTDDQGRDVLSCVPGEVAGRPWPAWVADDERIAGPPTLIGHLDVTPENVVFRDGQAVALIDFDLARPATRVEQVCNVLMWWAPLMPPADREAVLVDVDAVRRAALIVDSYGLSAGDRQRVVPVARNSAARTWFGMRARAEVLGGGWARMWDAGIGDVIVRRQQWLAEHEQELHAALTG